MTVKSDVVTWIQDKLLRNRTDVHVSQYVRDGLPTDDMVARFPDGDEFLVSFIVVKRVKRVTSDELE